MAPRAEGAPVDRAMQVSFDWWRAERSNRSRGLSMSVGAANRSARTSPRRPGTNSTNRVKSPVAITRAISRPSCTWSAAISHRCESGSQRISPSPTKKSKHWQPPNISAGCENASRTAGPRGQGRNTQKDSVPRAVCPTAGRRRRIRSDLCQGNPHPAGLGRPAGGPPPATRDRLRARSYTTGHPPSALVSVPSKTRTAVT